MISKFHRVLDPLDVEILERAVDQAWAAFKDCETSIESDCDQALEAALHRELIEIAKLYGVTESRYAAPSCPDRHASRLPLHRLKRSSYQAAPRLSPAKRIEHGVAGH